ncbi:MAG: L,D-transpeptidase, partial [Anaerolineales bacterium]
LYEDTIVLWLREVVGTNLYRYNQRYVETPEGYIWAADLQPVRNKPAQPVREISETSLGPGMWAQVSVPYVDLILDNPPARAPWLQSALEYGYPPRLYYSQILWVDDVKFDENDEIWYRVNERYGFGDIFWASARAFHPITPEEIAPISPDVEEKRVLIDITRQTLSCLEGSTEVYFCRISTGAKFDASGNEVDKWATPTGKHRTWRKMISTHMVGGTTGGGYDLPGIGWTILFVGTGIAIHSTYWHNDFGTPRSHGCVNAQPDDARWVFRWITPVVEYDPGDVTVEMPGGTMIQVIES